jgi:hypothetical protein
MFRFLTIVRHAHRFTIAIGPRCHLPIAIVILVEMGLMIQLVTHGYCDRARLPIPNIVHEQPQLQVCHTSLTEIGRRHVKKFHTNFSVVHCPGESISSPAMLLRCCWMV